MADANEAWRVDQALRAAQALREFDLIWLEEPIRPDDFAGYAHLRAHGGVPLAAGENLHTLAEFTGLIAAGGVDFPEPDLTTCGGVTPFMKIARLAEANNLPVISHGAHDLHIQFCWPPARTPPIWKCTPSAWKSSWPRRSRSRKATPSPRTAPATASISTSRLWPACVWDSTIPCIDGEESTAAIRTCYQSHVDYENGATYWDNLDRHLDAIVGDGTTLEIVGITPHDSYAHPLVEFRCARELPCNAPRDLSWDPL